ncbi:efflux RND transporter permease subunit [Enemella sp. A6]|uniref:efflux RND transporter permease subunit n=1 Tax=Enemella sp. A6 TaxID=3440152 RepID=UPI003EBACD24
MKRIASLSMTNRALIALITIFVMIFGVITARSLKQELIPSISIPVAVVFVSYPGASPAVVEERVTVPIEQAVGSLQGLESTNSTSSTGSATVVVEMTYGTNMSVAQQDVKAAVDRIEGLLPDEADVQVFTGSVDDLPVLQVAVSDDTDRGNLAARVDALVMNDLEKIDGVRAVSLTGAPVPQVLVDVDHEALAENGIGLDAVQQALGAAGQRVSAGELTEGEKKLAVTVGQRFGSADDVAALRIATPDGKTIRLDEVAEVTRKNEAASSLSRTNGEPSLTLAITKTPDGNTVQISKEVKALLPTLAGELGQGAEFTTVFDQAPFIIQSIDDLLREGGLGLIMAVIVILVFLLSVRSTLVTAVSIPTSVLAALIGMQVFGYTLNILTLGALTIAIGRVVDDSIVVIENIKRHLSYGTAKHRAVLTGVQEVATAITSATITTVAVFLPLGLVGGQVGELFRPFAMTTTLALMASLLVALTIVPVLAYWFLPRPTGEVDRAEVQARAEAEERRSWLQRLYVPTLGWALNHKIAVLLIGVLLLGTTGALATRLDTTFLGDTGQNTLRVQQQFTPGLSLAKQDELARPVEDALLKVDGVETVQTTVGSAGGLDVFAGSSADSASFAVTIDPEADATAVTAQVRERIESITDAGELTVVAGSEFGSNTIDVIVDAPDSERLAEASETVTAAMREVEGTADVTSSLSADRPTVEIVIDRTKAADRGVAPESVAGTVRGLLAPQQVNTIESGAATYDVVLQVGDSPKSVAELGDIELAGMPAEATPGQVPAGQGQPGQPQQPAEPVTVRLGDIASIKEVLVPTSLGRNDGQRSATVSLTPTEANLGAVTQRVEEKLAEVSLPEGVDVRVGGVSAEQSDAFSQLGLALLVAVAIVYVVMVATFKSLVQPLILLVSIPFAGIGSAAALLITDTPLGVPALIGLLMLVGVVVTNAIVLIDLVNQYRDQGQSPRDAVLNGARQRLRPILMTSVATICALLPMGLGLTGGGVFISKPLAVVVIGGLLSSTFLTLILVPVLYLLIQRGKRDDVRFDEAIPGEPEPAVAGLEVKPRRAIEG